MYNIIQLSLHDDSDDKEEIFNTKSSAKKGKSEKEDTIKTTKTKSDASLSNANQEENANFRKPTLTNKERARKARQRKKKYYEDLEKQS